MLAWLERMNFNEGGADCPPKEPGYVSRGDLSCHFNEGGADCPPKVRPPRSGMRLSCHFNEGGADCPPKGRLADDDPVVWALLQ